jgi:hypothetical protein
MHRHRRCDVMCNGSISLAELNCNITCVFYLSTPAICSCLITNSTPVTYEKIASVLTLPKSAGFLQVLQFYYAVKAHFHSIKIFTDRIYSENIIVLKIFNFKFFFRTKICVGQSHFTKFSYCRKFSRVEMSLYTGPKEWSLLDLK